MDEQTSPRRQTWFLASLAAVFVIAVALLFLGFYTGAAMVLGGGTLLVLSAKLMNDLGD